MKNTLTYSLLFTPTESPIFQVTGQFIAQESREYFFHFPCWRPGRYEEGLFLKRVGNLIWSVNKQIISPPRTHNLGFKLALAAEDRLEFSYEVHCQTLDAGSSYVAKGLKYINPIQSFFHISNAACAYTITWQEDYPYYGQVPAVDQSVHFASEQEMYDAPFFLCKPGESVITKVNGIPIGMHFFGITHPLELPVIEKDLIAFSQAQIDAMGYPHKRYDYFVIVLPHLAYHGVEHTQSCVITIGPDTELGTTRYRELLGVSSHEFFHVYNVKGLRPKELTPYSFHTLPRSENLFLCEGITSYLGDYFLWNAHVFSDEEYLLELNQLLHRYQLNHGRFKKSLREGSFEVGIDGYGSGPEHRSTNIYVDGALWSWCLDLALLNQSGGTIGLVEVFKKFYDQQCAVFKASHDIPFLFDAFAIAFRSYLNAEDHDFYFSTALSEPQDFVAILRPLLPLFSLEEDPEKFDPLYQKAGVKINNEKIVSLHPESPLYTYGLRRGDRIKIQLKKDEFQCKYTKKLNGEVGTLSGPTSDFNILQLKWSKDTAWKRTWRTRKQ